MFISIESTACVAHALLITCTQIEQSSSSRLAGELPTAPIFLNKKLVNLDAVIYFFQRSDRDLVSLKG